MDLRHVFEEVAHLGLELGRSIEAMENEPTLEQERVAQSKVLERWPELLDRATWWTVFRITFIDGYWFGKTDPAGARARVEIKRASRLQAPKG